MYGAVVVVVAVSVSVAVSEQFLGSVSGSVFN
jgi:hypothetical protein